MTVTESQMLEGVYPTSWDEFVGQPQAKALLHVVIASALARGVRCPHVLIASGEPGVGKSALAQLIARAMGTKMHIVGGKMTLPQVRMLFAGDVSPGDVVMYDELQTVVKGGKGNADWMLHLLENGTILGPMGPEDVPDVTVVGTTTDIGKLPDTIRDRFPVQPAIVPYTNEEAAEIALELSAKVFYGLHLPLPGEANCVSLARLATNNPRMMRSLIENLRDLAIVHKCANYNPETFEYDLSELLSLMSLTEDGLDSTARRYLRVLAKNFSGMPAGERAIADVLNEPGGIVRVERVLMRRGLVIRTKGGRMLTAEGVRRAKELTA